MNTESYEYFEGTQTISHEDGSTTYITTEHVPYVEPLTTAQQIAVLGVTAAAITGVIALPYILDRADEWSQHRKLVRAAKKEKKIQDIKDQTNN